MTSFLGWRQAFKSAVMAGSDSMCRAGNVRTMNRNRRSLEHVWPAPRSARWRSAARPWRPIMPLKAPYFRPAFDWTGFYIGGHTGYGRGSSSAVLTDPGHRHDQQQSSAA